MFSVLFRSYSCFKMTGRFGLAGDKKNRPKQCIWCCLALGVFFFSLCFCILTNNFYSI